MGKFHDAADTIRRHAKIYQGFVDAAKALEEAGQIEQAVTEGRAAVRAAADDLDKLRIAIQAANDDLVAAKSEADIVRVRLANDREAARQQAEVEADAMVARAQAQAEDITDAAIVDAEAAKRAVNADVELLLQTKGELQAFNAKLRDEKTILQLDATAAEHRLLKAKEAINKMLGGAG